MLRPVAAAKGEPISASRVACLLLALALWGPLAKAESERTFEATWSATGRLTTLRLGSQEAATVYLSGPFVVTSGEGLGAGFRAEAVGFDDGAHHTIGKLAL